MTADERLALIRAKVDRAKEHIVNLERVLEAFWATDPYVVSTEPNPDTPNGIAHILTSMKPTPAIVPLVVGDILFNLRASLDHLTYHLVVMRGNDPKNTYFPITNSSTGYESESKGKVKGMDDTAIKKIREFNPYKGGNDALWHLHRLNIIDKHRAILTVGSMVAYQTLPRRLWSSINSFTARHNRLPDDFFDGPDIKVLSVTATYPKGSPLKEGDELFLGNQPILKTDEKVKITFAIAFDEPQIIECKPIVPTLHQMADFIDNLIVSFRPLLA